MSAKERETLRQLNERVKEQPDCPLPKDFVRVRERVAVETYAVPDAVVPFIGEPKAVCTELVDELLSKLFGIHVLEGVVTMQDQYRVKPSAARVQRDSQGGRSNRAEALSIIRRAEEKRGSLPGGGSRHTNRSNLPKIGQPRALTLDDLPPVYARLASRAPRAKRPIYEEVAVIVENMVRKTAGQEALGTEEPRDAASSHDSRRFSVTDSQDGAGRNVKLLPPLEPDDINLDGARGNFL